MAEGLGMGMGALMTGEEREVVGEVAEERTSDERRLAREVDLAKNEGAGGSSGGEGDEGLVSSIGGRAMVVDKTGWLCSLRSANGGGWGSGSSATETVSARRKTHGREGQTVRCLVAVGVAHQDVHLGISGRRQTSSFAGSGFFSVLVPSRASVA